MIEPHNNVSTRRRGKIARLPYNIREQVNQRLRDGYTYASIAKWLQSSGYDVSEDNVRNWHNGHGNMSGYQEWLREQERIAELERRREWAMQIVQAGAGEKFSEAAILDAASKLFDVSSEFDPALLRAKLEDDPELYLELTKAIARLAKPELEFRKYKEQVARAKREIETATAQAKDAGGLSEETLKKIEQAAALL